MGEEPQYPVKRRLHDAQSWSKCFGEDYKLTPAVNQTPCP